MITLTKDQLTAMGPCNAEARLALFGRRKSMNVAQALKAGATIRDILWVAGRLGHKDKCVQFALLVAQRAAQHDKSGTAQPCLDAANAYAANPNAGNLATLRQKRSAAYAAAAVYAAYAVDAVDAAAAAAYAYAAAAYAVYAVDAYARQAEIEAQELVLIEIFGA